MTDETLFDDHDVDHRPDQAHRRAVRRHVLAAVLSTWRAERGWSVNDAASKASIAPMTWRRMEQGLDVRRRTLTALDGVLGQPLGTVTRALNDDYLMVSLAGQSAVIAPSDLDDDPAVVLDRVAARQNGTHHRRQVVETVGIASEEAVGTPTVRVHPATATGAGTAGDVTAAATAALGGMRSHAGSWPVVDEATRRALVALSMHVPAARPTALEAVQRMVERLAPLTVQSEAIAAAVRAAVAAMPDLIALQVVEAGSECDVDAAEHQGAHDDAER